MSFCRLATAAGLMAVAVLVGCDGGDHRTAEARSDQPASKPDLFQHPNPDDWEGEESVDPAGDMARLQGSWRLASYGGHPLTPTTDVGELEVSGNVITFAWPQQRARNSEGHTNRYRFVVNTAHTPKTLRVLVRLGDDPVPKRRGEPFSKWYRLDGDEITFFGGWAKYHGKDAVGPEHTYRRVR